MTGGLRRFCERREVNDQGFDVHDELSGVDDDAFAVESAVSYLRV